MAQERRARGVQHLAPLVRLELDAAAGGTAWCLWVLHFPPPAKSLQGLSAGENAVPPSNPSKVMAPCLVGGSVVTKSDHEVIVGAPGDEDTRLYYIWSQFSTKKKKKFFWKAAQISSFYASLSHKDELPVVLPVHDCPLAHHVVTTASSLSPSRLHFENRDQV